MKNILAGAGGQTLEPHELLSIATGEARLESTESESHEQAALLELLGEAIDAETAAETAAETFPPTEKAGTLADDPATLEDAAQFPELNPLLREPQPRAVDVAAVQRRLGMLKRRRSRLTEARGSDVPSLELASVASQGQLGVMLEAKEREYGRSLSSFSLARASIVDFEKDGSNALTKDARTIILENVRAPRTGHPLFGLQMAYERARNPPCPRCGRAVSERGKVSGEEICVACYREIYLVDGIAQGGQGSTRVWDEEGRRAKVREEERAGEEAVSVSLKMLESQRGKLPRKRQAGSTVKMSLSDNQTTGTRGVSEGGTSLGATRTDGTGSGSIGDDEPPSSGWGVRSKDGWEVLASERSLRTINPIRNLIQNIEVKPNPDKELIKLSIGDPTVYGNLKACEQAKKRFCEVIQSDKANGYTMSMGSEEARVAVARRYTTDASPLTPDDVVLTGGTSGALETAIGAIANEGDNILLPQPGFPLFRTIAEGYGIECRYYKTNPDKNWEIEFGSLVEIADERTRAIVVNNPSNPCGSVFSPSHIEDLMATASMLKVPIIADEVYADMLFSESDFTPMGSKSIDVPVLSVGGISKQFVVPGWRLGWILIHDRNDVLEKGGVRKGIRQLTTRMLVPNSPAQAVLPSLLAQGVEDPAFKAVMEELRENAKFTMQALAGARGLRLIEPQGAMYAMAEVDVGLLGFKDDMEFTEKLLEEEAVFVLPGCCFQAKNFVRIVFAAPKQTLSEAFFRMRSFCARHSGSL